MSLESELKKTNTLLTQLLERLPVAGSSSVSVVNANTVTVAPDVATSASAVIGGELRQSSSNEANVTVNSEVTETKAPTEIETADFAELRAQLTKTITAKAAAHTDEIRAILSKYDATRLPEVADHDLKAVTAEIAEL